MLARDLGPGAVGVETQVRLPVLARFLGLTGEQRAALLEVHGEIFDVAWWQAIQARLVAGEFNDVPPYPEQVRL